VWNHLKLYTGVPNTSSSLDLIVDCLIPMSPKRSARSVISKLTFAASCHFICQERNNILFKNQKRSEVQVSDVIKSTVYLKLLSCKFKKTNNVGVYCTDGSCQIPLSGLLIDAFSSLFFLVEEGDVK
ncbi:hypothetical protein Tco_1332924, partial [Tanacetum coccineum]